MFRLAGHSEMTGSRATARISIAIVAALAFGSIAPAGGAPRITGIDPARTDTSLVCTILTRGLPDPQSMETIQSGLPAALLLRVTVLDGRGQAIADEDLDVRVEPDLWERVFNIRTPGETRRAATIEELIASLARLGPFNLARARDVEAETSLRLRIRVAVYPLAPPERERARDLFGSRGADETADRREVSVGVSSLVRFFLKRGRGAQWVADTTSAAFVYSSLPGLP